VLVDRWSERAAPVSHLRAPSQEEVVGARDEADRLLTPPGSLGVLDRAVDRAVALGHADLSSGVLVLAAGHHRVLDLGVSAFADSVTDDVVTAARAGEAVGTVAARASGLRSWVVDCGSATGNLRDEDALTTDLVAELIERGRVEGAELGAEGLVALGEVGMGNTTVAAALAAVLLDLPPEDVVGLGAGADTAMLLRKRDVVAAALTRTGPTADAVRALAAVGGPEAAYLTGVTLGAASAGAVVVLDGLLTSLAALCAVLVEPAVDQHLVAGQRSRERAHAAVLLRLGLEPLLDLRLRAGEGVGACLAAGLVLSGLRVRRESAHTS
jgi:nicotinate-nucleotide--dimethylbenzimidazole phosphoribosyltransferase